MRKYIRLINIIFGSYQWCKTQWRNRTILPIIRLITNTNTTSLQRPIMEKRKVFEALYHINPNIQTLASSHKASYFVLSLRVTCSKKMTRSSSNAKPKLKYYRIVYNASNLAKRISSIKWVNFLSSMPI